MYHPDYMAPLKPGHRFPMSKYGYLKDALIKRGLLSSGGFFAPAPATAARLSAVHEYGYVDRVITQRLRPDEVREIGLPGTERVARRAMLSAAGTTLAARLAIEHGIACNAAGGSHHAAPNKGAGFCVFNDVAVAAQALLDDGIVSRILIVDCDVHQGDGTARIFENDPRVFTMSLHAAKNYPVRKAVSDLDVPLPDGMADTAYLERLKSVLSPLWDQIRPQIMFYNAGVDPYNGDKLGRLSLSYAGLRARDAFVIGAARSRDIPCVGVLGGGYSDDPAEVAERHAILFEEAAAYAA